MTNVFGFDQDSIYLSPAPLYHSAPLFYCMSTLRLGGTVVVMEHFDPVESLAVHRAVRHHVQPVGAHEFVRMFKLGADDVRTRYDLSSLKSAMHAAAPCPVEVKQRDDRVVGPDRVRSTTRPPRAWARRSSTRGLARASRLGRAAMLGADPHPRRRQQRTPCRRGGHRVVRARVVTTGVRVPQGRGQDGRGDQCQGLVDRGRHGLPRRRGLPLPHRSSHVHDRVGGREHLPAGGREPARHAPEGVRRRGVRHPRPRHGRARARRSCSRRCGTTPDRSSGRADRRSADSISRTTSARRRSTSTRNCPRQPTGKLYKRLIRDRYWGDSNSRIV